MVRGKKISKQIHGIYQNGKSIFNFIFHVRVHFFLKKEKLK